MCLFVCYVLLLALFACLVFDCGLCLFGLYVWSLVRVCLFVVHVVIARTHTLMVNGLCVCVGACLFVVFVRVVTLMCVFWFYLVWFGLIWLGSARLCVIWFAPTCVFLVCLVCLFVSLFSCEFL